MEIEIKGIDLDKLSLVQPSEHTNTFIDLDWLGDRQAWLLIEAIPWAMERVY